MGKTFHAAAQRACAYLVEACGAKDLADYSRADALKYRDYLIAKGMAGSSVSRVISSIRAVMNFAISEYALDLKNLFVGMYHDRLAVSSTTARQGPQSVFLCHLRLW